MKDKARIELMKKIVALYPEWSNYQLMSYFARTFNADRMSDEEVKKFHVMVSKALRDRND